MPNDVYIKQADAVLAVQKRIAQIGMGNNPYVYSIRQAVRDVPAADVEPKQRWIPVTERLPEEGVYVLVYDGGIDVAKIEMGLSEGTRERMKKGELPDPIETGWCATGIVHYHRSEVYRECDEWGNNEAPYCWRVYANPATLFGQNVKYWMPLPELPKGEDNEIL